MAISKSKQKTRKTTSTNEWDSVFAFKLVLFLILGSQWLYIINSADNSQLPIPFGAVIALAFAAHDHFKIDRKIEYAVILLALFIGFWLPMGITFSR